MALGHACAMLGCSRPVLRFLTLARSLLLHVSKLVTNVLLYVYMSTPVTLHGPQAASARQGGAQLWARGRGINIRGRTRTPGARSALARPRGPSRRGARLEGITPETSAHWTRQLLLWVMGKGSTADAAAGSPSAAGASWSPHEDTRDETPAAEWGEEFLSPGRYTIRPAPAMHTCLLVATKKRHMAVRCR